MLSTANLSVQFGSKPLFENISIKFGEGNRYGLIGANGCGKSTLMKVLTGELMPNEGSVSYDVNERIGKLNQDQFAFEEYTVIDTVIMGHKELWDIKWERDQIYAKAQMSEADGMRAAELEASFAELDGYTAEARAGELLLGVDIPIEQHYGPMSAVAPGWKLRVLLVQALFADPDILLLDEPTNNLDINTIRWLEDVLNERESTIIIISHDRHFLNSVCTHIADLDYGELRVYPGNYDDYMLASTQARERMLSDNEKKKAQIADLQSFVSRFSANASKAKQATSRARQIEKIKLEEIKPSSRVNPYIRFQQEKQLHRLVLELEKVSLGYDNNDLINDMSSIIEVGARVAIIGSNGVGKTTLLKKLIGDAEQSQALVKDTGTVKWSENVSWGYYAQDNSAEFTEEMTLLEWMTQWRKPSDDEQAVRGILGRLLFSQDEIHKSVNALSGGEKGRMMFGKFMMCKPNVLIMDEPTNHLDMESIESLNLALENYPGTLLFVSHDRQFVSSIATRIIEITPEGVNDFSGNYEDYLKSQGT